MAEPLGKKDGMMECWNTGMLGMGHPDSLIVPPFHDSTIPVFPFRPIGGFPRRGGRLCGKSLDRRLRLLDSGLLRLCPVSSGSGHV